MTLTVSLGKTHPARIVKTASLSWEQYADLLSTAPESTDKASRGWSCPARFNPAYRDSENFVARYALTFDYDHVTEADLDRIREAYATLEHLAYTTWSHTPEHPRWRYVLPLSRPAAYDEFQAVSRKVASYASVEFTASESHKPTQFMYLPTVRSGETLQILRNPGTRVDVDAVLATYADWTDRKQWPRRDKSDDVHSPGTAVDPRTKPGLIGAFCRAYTIEAAIEHFNLPYDKVR